MCVCEYSINFLLGYFRLFIIFVGQFVNGIRAIYKFFSKYKRTFQARILEGLFCFMELVHAPISSSDIVAVYKITFDNKWFYIGSSSKLKDIYHLIHNAELQIIEILIPTTSNFDLIRKIEHELILENWDNPLLLNATQKTINNYTILQVSHKEFIKFNSISDAAKHNNVCPQTIKKALNSKSGFYKGYIWKYA